jgi:hypothetical protein
MESGRADEATLAIYELLNRAGEVDVAEGARMIRRELPRLVETFAASHPAVRGRVEELALRTEGGEAVRELALELLDEDLRLFRSFRDDVPKASSPGGRPFASGRKTTLLSSAPRSASTRSSLVCQRMIAPRSSRPCARSSAARRGALRAARCGLLGSPIPSPEGTVDGGTVYSLGFDDIGDGDGGWFCSCPAFGRCAHLIALQLVTVRPPLPPPRKGAASSRA